MNYRLKVVSTELFVYFFFWLESCDMAAGWRWKQAKIEAQAHAILLGSKIDSES